ncbi:unnamed protein product [Ambrosiozyma monospora]|uniref:Unnamed protein product n=1 Tax=Ambrosiozyma monospora TaxID=43982 RepID=A0ACB5T1V5_AMBMO|nr:unnamed protein product [Ambrosiozyma monospora]
MGESKLFSVLQINNIDQLVHLTNIEVFFIISATYGTHLQPFFSQLPEFHTSFTLLCSHTVSYDHEDVFVDGNSSHNHFKNLQKLTIELSPSYTTFNVSSLPPVQILNLGNVPASIIGNFPSSVRHLKIYSLSLPEDERSLAKLWTQLIVPMKNLVNLSLSFTWDEIRKLDLRSLKFPHRLCSVELTFWIQPSVIIFDFLPDSLIYFILNTSVYSPRGHTTTIQVDEGKGSCLESIKDKISVYHRLCDLGSLNWEVYENFNQ